MVFLIISQHLGYLFNSWFRSLSIFLLHFCKGSRLVSKLIGQKCLICISRIAKLLFFVIKIILISVFKHILHFLLS